MGALSAIFLVALTVPIYSDYSDRAITSEMLFSVKPIQKEVESLLISGNDIQVDLENHDVSAYIKNIAISDEGSITVQGGNSGQLFILIPRNEAGLINWKCFGGSYDAMPIICRDTR